MASMTAGEALVHLLAAYGVDTLFGIPGTHSIELYRGLESGKIRHISPRHEQGGGFMADGYARASGKPGVCFVITGPGVTNITTPMGEAYMDSVPMLVISPVNDPDPDEINRGRLHEITSQEKITRPISALTMTVSHASEIPGAVQAAFDIFNSQRPGPVHINIPLSVIPLTVSSPWLPKPAACPATASDSEIARALKMISKAKVPCLVIGGGTTSGSLKIIQLAEKLCCPVLSTVAGRGVIPKSHPLGVGAQLRAPYVQRILQNSDLGIFLGTEFTQTDHWNDDLALPAEQIWVNLDPHALRKANHSTFILADCVDFAKRLAQALPSAENSQLESIHKQCEGYRRQQKNNFTHRQTLHWNVLEVITESVPENVTIVSDMTQLAYTAVGFLPMNRPNQWLHPTGYGTLGYALPAAIGAVLSNEANPALAIVGDAGFQYTFAEMTLASELELNIVVLLWNNDALQQIQDDMDNAKIKRIGVTQKNPDFIALAKACHWEAWEVEGLETMGTDLKRAFSCTGPVLLKLDELSLRKE